jgi:hypothetical protein
MTDQFPASGPATFKDLQAATGIPRVRLYQAIERGEVPARKIGGRIYTRHEWIRQWCETGAWNPDAITTTPEPTDPIRPEAV